MRNLVGGGDRVPFASRRVAELKAGDGFSFSVGQSRSSPIAGDRRLEAVRVINHPI